MKVFTKINLFLALTRAKLRWMWWDIRYGGRKNIPKEVIAGRLKGIAKGLGEVNDELARLIKIASDNISEEQKQALLDLLRRTANVEEEFEEIKQKERCVLGAKLNKE